MKIFNSLVLLIVIPFCAFCQDWYEDGARWFYNFEDEQGGDGYIQFLVTGDSLIDSKTYKKIDYQIFNSTGNPIFYREAHYLVYEENDKVYFWDKDSLKSFLMYDFTLNVGEVLDVDIYIDDPAKFSVSQIFLDSVETIMISGVPREVQYFSYTVSEVGFNTWKENFIVIESIGYMYGENEISYKVVFDPLISVDQVGRTENRLRCYSDINLSYVNDWWSGNCDSLISASQENIDVSNRRVLFPNPTSTLLNVSMQGEFKILDLSGMIINSYTSSPVNVSTYSPGVYIVTDRLGNSAKFIVD